MKKVFCIIGLFLVVLGVFRMGVSGSENSFILKYEKAMYLLEDSPIVALTDFTINSIYSACSWLSSTPLDFTNWNSYFKLVQGVRNGTISNGVFDFLSGALDVIASAGNAFLMCVSMILFIVYFIVCLFAYVCDLIAAVMLLIYA